MVGISPGWLGRVFTRLGVRGTFRTLDAHSNRLDPTAERGHEWELMTYLQTTLGGTP